MFIVCQNGDPTSRNFRFLLAQSEKFSIFNWSHRVCRGQCWWHILFIWKRVFFFFFLPAMLLCAGRTFPHDWTMCDLNACYRGSWWKIVLATAGFPFIMHFFTEGSMFQKLGLRTRINFSLSEGVIPLKNSHEEVEIEAGFQRFNKKFAEKIYGIINFRNNLTDVDCRLIYR